MSKQSDCVRVHRYTTHLFRHVRVRAKLKIDSYFRLYLGNNSRITAEIFMKLLYCKF